MIKKIAGLVCLLGGLVSIYFFLPEEEIEIVEEEKVAEKIVEVTEELPPEPSNIYVEIKGAVKAPGVYKMLETDRVVNLIKKAGGVLKNANLDNINQALILRDEMSIKILTEEETKKEVIPITPALISINSGTLDQLITLPNIGEVTAQNIINYRNQNGRFEKLEDLMNVSGIGESTFAKVKNYITL